MPGQTTATLQITDGSTVLATLEYNLEELIAVAIVSNVNIGRCGDGSGAINQVTVSVKNVGQVAIGDLVIAFTVNNTGCVGGVAPSPNSFGNFVPNQTGDFTFECEVGVTSLTMNFYDYDVSAFMPLLSYPFQA